MHHQMQFFYADYEYHAFSVEKLSFDVKTKALYFPKNRILNFLTKKFCLKDSEDIPSDAEFHCLLNGLFSFPLRS